jgi:hypothetical protein
LPRNLSADWRKEQNAPLEGWDLSRAGNRIRFGPVPWDYRALARDLLDGSRQMLDMGTGGGEFLERLAPLPAFSVATELIPERAQIARKRLSPYGVTVVVVDQTAGMPFGREVFDLILCHNSAFVAKSVHPLIAAGGAFFTQQVGRENLRDLLREFSMAEGNKDWQSPDEAAIALEAAGFSDVVIETARPHIEFKDVGAMLYFLNGILPGRIDVCVHYDALLRLHTKVENGEVLRFPLSRYLVKARK